MMLTRYPHSGQAISAMRGRFLAGRRQPKLVLDRCRRALVLLCKSEKLLPQPFVVNEFNRVPEVLSLSAVTTRCRLRVGLHGHLGRRLEMRSQCFARCSWCAATSSRRLNSARLSWARAFSRRAFLRCHSKNTLASHLGTVWRGRYALPARA